MTSTSELKGQATSPKSGSLTEQVYAGLRNQILTAERQPESLLLEHELATEFGVSKTPIREALRLLVHEGWVVVLPRKGYLVRPLRLSDVREIFALRQVIEPFVVAEAIKRATPEQLTDLETLVTAQAEATDSHEALDAATAFHIGIAKLCGNERAERVLTGLVDEARRMNSMSPVLVRRVREDAEISDHQNILEAMRREDVDLAQEVMARHSKESLRQKLVGLTEI